MSEDVVPQILDWWHENRQIWFLILALLSLTCYLCLLYFRKVSRERLQASKRLHPLVLKHKAYEKAVGASEGQRSPTTTSELSESTIKKPFSSNPKRIPGSSAKKHLDPPHVQCQIRPLVFYFSLTENTRRYALDDLRTFFQQDLSCASILDPEFLDLAEVDHEDYFEREPLLQKTQGVKCFYILLIPSYNIDTALDNFIALLQETHNDFRIDSGPLAALAGFSVFGFGDSEGWPSLAEGFCQQAFRVDKWMARLTAKKRAYPLGLGDTKSNASSELQTWASGVFKAMQEIAEAGHLGQGVLGSGEALESDEEDEDLPNFKAIRKTKGGKQALADLEDLGGQRKRKNVLPVDFTTSTSSAGPKAMVPVASPTYNALTKQGYTIVGSHSGVKICRWTKSALRGRGSCYKFSFYGIQSHLCMETTPSLSCSNKCVFCWRHGTNPVGTTWRWEVDPPDLIFAGAKEGHYKKIKMMRGVPGVIAERFQEAMRIRHCALSLVGEPIFYPHINELLALLHRDRISSFLVCNAQHPDHLAALKTVTQLYVSIDASNAESLRKIDRPLHRDYWQRFLRCLDILRDKRFQMRTVYRLTLVKGFNVDEEVDGYADLVARGLPCFVEIKGVTYCGTSTSKSAGLTMQNVPFYEEIVTFVEALNAALEKRGLEYGIAAEHAHSCCALIGSRRFYVEGKWHTLIDYEKYFDCLSSGSAFGPEDYMGAPTPEWATWGRGGFDPRDQRVDRKGRVIDQGG